VRSCQAQALTPMMQFSLGPWRALSSAEDVAACREAVRLHEKETPRILELARLASKTGEPIVRLMEYVFPHQGFEDCRDQFMLGDDLLVAPVVTADDARDVRLPAGCWTDDLGERHTGPATLRLRDVPLARLPHYRRSLK